MVGPPGTGKTLLAKAVAGEADVEAVDITQNGDVFSFSVTVRHNDHGWDHYANRWDIVTLDGDVLGERIFCAAKSDCYRGLRPERFTVSAYREDLA